MPSGALILIPTPLGELAPLDTIPEAARRALGEVDLLLVENERAARRYLARAGIARGLDGVEFHELSEHTRPEDLEPYVAAMAQGRRVGVVSEAGCPGIADPGADLARLCHERGIQVIALPGPSSVILAVMASGLGGQSFAFHGYLPVKPEARMKAIRDVERRAVDHGQTQVFIETPYRNDRLLADLLTVCRPETLVCVAVDLCTPHEYVATKRVAQWRAAPALPLKKRPALFLLGR